MSRKDIVRAEILACDAARQAAELATTIVHAGSSLERWPGPRRDQRSIYLESADRIITELRATVDEIERNLPDHAGRQPLAEAAQKRRSRRGVS